MSADRMPANARAATRGIVGNSSSRAHAFRSDWPKRDDRWPNVATRACDRSRLVGGVEALGATNDVAMHAEQARRLRLVPSGETERLVDERLFDQLELVSAGRPEHATYQVGQQRLGGAE